MQQNLFIFLDAKIEIISNIQVSYFTRGFPVLHSGNGQGTQERQQQTNAQLIAPISLSKT